ncbi:MAG: ACP S-malonyltransferase [Elusimicrobia bacterium]|nr:ACP S-malonyltransferase [Candidatus Obscuribacterium magneticum]
MVNRIAFLFPGQGSQSIGMGKTYADLSPKAARFIHEADRILGFPLSTFMFEGPEEKLKETSITQPALFVTSAAALEILKERGLHAQWAAGHSVGEYAALYAAGVIKFEDALRLVRARGDAMHEASLKNVGTMAAIIGLDVAKITEVCQEVSKEGGLCTPANFNTASQTVVAGTPEAVAKVMEKCKALGAAKVVRLNVEGAFHSPLMAPAAEKMKEVIENVEFSKPLLAVLTNVDAQITRDPEEFKRKLIRQMDHPVRWDESLQRIMEEGADTFIEVGAGKVLSSMVKRLDRQKTALYTDDFGEIDKHVSVKI